MTDFERRALMGDKKAQEECTEKGIVLPCPYCGGQAKITYSIEDHVDDLYTWYIVGCRICGTSTFSYIAYREHYRNGEREAISDWNTRVLPNFWPCGACEYGQVNKDGSFYCPYFHALTADTNQEIDCCCKYKPREES